MRCLACLQGVEIKKLVQQASRQQDLVDQAAQSVGLPSGQLLEDLVQLRQQVSVQLRQQVSVQLRQQVGVQLRQQASTHTAGWCWGNGLNTAQQDRHDLHRHGCAICGALLFCVYVCVYSRCRSPTCLTGCWSVTPS